MPVNEFVDLFVHMRIAMSTWLEKRIAELSEEIRNYPVPIAAATSTCRRCWRNARVCFPNLKNKAAAPKRCGPTMEAAMPHNLFDTLQSFKHGKFYSLPALEKALG